ncbi:MAG: germination protein YpeB [Oscillospiraceae bacterium]|jgi:germination protein YpeB|nr:germination protein YpeB [Oscillospiraceae bacterium]
MRNPDLKIKKASLIRLIAFFAAALVVLGGFTYQARADAAHNRYLLEVRYRHAFAEFVNAVEEVERSLQKSYYATTPPMIASSCADVYGKASAARQALGELPFSDYQLENIAAYLSKVADYTFALAKNAYDGKNYTDEAGGNLRTLSEIATTLNANLRGVEQDLSSGAITVQELKKENEKLEAAGEETPVDLGGSFSKIETEFPEIPALVYDGPFSQHIQAKEPAWIKDLPDVDEQTALQTAAEFTGLTNLESLGKRGGGLPCYVFGAGDASVTVSVQGGKVLQYCNPKGIVSSNLPPEEAIGYAKQFLERYGYGSMQESYYTRSDNALLINFAYVQEGVVCYPDLVKVNVALDSGEVIGFESVGYVMNHIEQREIPAAAIKQEQAKAMVSGELKILSGALAIIPSPGENELFVHEFKCESSDGRHYIVCVSALSGNVEKILILLEDENGTLAV